jgi:transposase
MYTRIKTTPNSPRKSVQIVESMRHGNKISQKIVRHVGIAMDNDELERLSHLAEVIIEKLKQENKPSLFTPEELASARKRPLAAKVKFEEEDYSCDTRNLVEEARVVQGIHDVYGGLFDELDMAHIFKNPARNVAMVECFKNMVLSRIANPKSKLASVDMLEKDFGISLDVDRVYRMMDSVDEEAIIKLNQLTARHTRAILKQKIDVVFYDCTTLYFESFTGDELRKNGYSKDLKFSQPQILLALMVTREGLPIAYEVFSGDSYEGHTFIPALNKIKNNYDIDKIVVVADAGMFNRDNMSEIQNLHPNGVQFILGSRLRNLPKAVQEKVLNRKNYRQLNDNGDMIGRFEYEGKTLIVDFSQKRAYKDKMDRDATIDRLKAKLEKDKNTNSYISSFGFKKYLESSKGVKMKLSEEKINADILWDGLHGVITNTDTLTAEEVLTQYRHLYLVEEAFRINKHDLKIRPIFHWKPSRVRAHMAIAYCSFSLVRYLEYRVKLQYEKMSPEKIRQALMRVQYSVMYEEKKKVRYCIPSKVSEEAKKIYQCLNLKPATKSTILKKL